MYSIDMARLNGVYNVFTNVQSQLQSNQMMNNNQGQMGFNQQQGFNNQSQMQSNQMMSNNHGQRGFNQQGFINQSQQQSNQMMNNNQGQMGFNQQQGFNNQSQMQSNQMMSNNQGQRGFNQQGFSSQGQTGFTGIATAKIPDTTLYVHSSVGNMDLAKNDINIRFIDLGTRKYKRNIIMFRKGWALNDVYSDYMKEKARQQTYLSTLKNDYGYNLETAYTRDQMERLISWEKCEFRIAQAQDAIGGENKIVKIDDGKYIIYSEEYITKRDRFGDCFKKIKSLYQYEGLPEIKFDIDNELFKEFINPVSIMSMDGFKNYISGKRGDIKDILNAKFCLLDDLESLKGTEIGCMVLIEDQKFKYNPQDPTCVIYPKDKYEKDSVMDKVDKEKLMSFKPDILDVLSKLNYDEIDFWRTRG